MASVVPEMRLRTRSLPTLEPAACFEPTSASDTPIFEANELNLDRGHILLCTHKPRFGTCGFGHEVVQDTRNGRVQHCERII